ncbi:rod-determining factor RdfA [Halorubrum laminariae]|uniref:Rod-determining factor RdfA n=1 Tax=Halorubrum laminariae TaxID=1433523 RepID=A0ABD6C3P1_9EURY|nr:rod-determining factor RdfA [Halorubrum laminariae]
MSSQTSQHKIERVAQKYNLDGIENELVDNWGSKQSDKSIRELAAYFNLQVTDAALREAGVILDRDVVKSVAEQLADDPSSITASAFMNRDVDLRAVGDDLVTYQSVHNYLCDIRNEEYTEEVRNTAQIINDVRKLRGRVEVVDSQTVSTLIARDDVDSPAPNINIDVTAMCPACNTTTDLLRYLKNGGCPSPECKSNA